MNDRIKNVFVPFLYLIGMYMLCSCEKDGKVFLSPGNHYKNLEDTTTTSIIVSIPRLEFTASKMNHGIIAYVSVSDQDGNVLTGFNEQNFNIRYFCKDDADTLNVTSYSFLPDKDKRHRLAAGNTMDYSTSMSDNDIENMERAIRQFIRMKHEDDYMQIIKFSDHVEIVNAFSKDTLVLMNAIAKPFSRGWTAYFQAVYEGLEQADVFVKANHSYFPAVIAFTDGHDNRSNVNLNQTITRANNLQIPVYTVGFGSVNHGEMNRLADETGGRYFYTPTGQDILSLYQTISTQLNDIYGLTWTTYTLTCNELIIEVEVIYESSSGKHTAKASRSVNIMP